MHRIEVYGAGEWQPICGFVAEKITQTRAILHSYSFIPGFPLRRILLYAHALRTKSMVGSVEKVQPVRWS